MKSKQRNEHEHEHKHKQKQRRVLVLGSGISGLACAQELKFRNWQVMVVEARHRPGGRLKSLSLLDATNVNIDNTASHIPVQHTDTSSTSASPTCTSHYNVAQVTGQGFRPNNNKKKRHSWIQERNHGGRPLDLGGQFIHGIRHNPIYSMTQTLGLTAHSMSSCQLLTRQGDILSAERDVKMEAAFNQVLSQTWHDCQTLNQSTTTTTTSTPSSHSHSHSHGHGRLQEDEDSGLMSFGTVFERRARDMARTMEFSPEDQNVFKWHVTNLELSCGTSLDNLGYTWNDDEPYGYTGQHCLLEQSFGSLIQSLSHGIPIQYGCQVKHIQLVAPPSTTTYTSCTSSSTSPPSSLLVSNSTAGTSPSPSPAPPSTLFVPPEPTKRKITTSTTPITTNAKPPPRRRIASKPQRQSARLTGDTSHLVIPREDAIHHTNHTCKHKNHSRVRRSSRSHRKTPTRFTIDSLDAAYSYDNPQLTSSSSSSFKKKKPKTNTRSIPKVEDLLQDDDDEDERPKVRVVLESGLVLEADAVVCTLPVGVLKLEAPHHPDAVTFDPPLPERKRLAIQRLGCGRFNKCALLFDRVFWQDSDFIGFTATPATHILVTNLCRQPAIRPTIPATDSNQEDASSLSSAAAPILIMYYGGAHAHDMEELRDVQVVDDCMQVLRDNFGTDLVPDQPLDYAVTRWGMERFSRGAFSFVPPGVHGETELDLCGAPIYDPYQSNVNINVVSPPASDAHPQQRDEDVDPTSSNNINKIAHNTSNTASSSSSFTANNHVPVAVGSALQHGLAGDSSKEPSNGKADGEHENKHDAVVGSSSTSTSSSANAVAIEQSPSMSEERNENENDLPNTRRPVILFAGEHTTPYHPSTIHGAFSSGIREAYRLDVSWEPALNQNIQFDKTFLYQRTFPLKRKQRPKKEREQRQNTVSKTKKSPQPTSRIVTTEGGMKLRKRTAMIMNGSDKSGMPSSKKRQDHHHRTGGGNALQMSRQPQQKAPEPQQSSSGVRRSNRQISRFLQDGQYKGDINSSYYRNNGAGTKKEQLLVDGFSVAEDICLLRAVDTFSSKDSDAWEQIRTKTFDETKSVAQLEARYKTLVEEGADLDPSRWNQLPSSSSSLLSNNDKEYDEWSKSNWSLPNNETETWLAPKEVQPLVKAKQQKKASTSQGTHPTTIISQEVEQKENNNIRRSSRRRSSHWKYDSSDE